MAIKFNIDQSGELIRDESSKFSTWHTCLHGKQCEHLEYVADDSDDLPDWLVGHIGYLHCKLAQAEIEEMRRELFDCPEQKWTADWILWQSNVWENSINSKLDHQIDTSTPITASSIGYDPIKDT